MNLFDRLGELVREKDELRELLREALPFVETYESGDMLMQGMSMSTYDNLVIRLHMALDPLHEANMQAKQRKAELDAEADRIAAEYREAEK